MSPNKEEYPANLNATLVLIYSGSAIARARSVINDFVKTRQTLCAKSVRILQRDSIYIFIKSLKVSLKVYPKVSGSFCGRGRTGGI